MGVLSSPLFNNGEDHILLTCLQLTYHEANLGTNFGCLLFKINNNRPFDFGTTNKMLRCRPSTQDKQKKLLSTLQCRNSMYLRPPRYIFCTPLSGGALGVLLLLLHHDRAGPPWHWSRYNDMAWIPSIQTGERSMDILGRV